MDIQKSEKLLGLINSREAIVGVVGLGYVGLPFAVEAAKAGFKVVGIEMDAKKVDAINRGENYIQDVDDAELKTLVDKGLIKATKDFASVPSMDIVVIAVPTPLTPNLTPDLQFVETVTQQLSKYLRPGQLISLESTTYPGTTEEVMQPILEEKSKLKIEQDFFLAHSPERVDPGNKRFATKNTNKVVGAVGPESSKVAVAFYGQIIDNVVPVSNAKSAELVKVFENTFRAVNIALVNELTLLCDRMEINVWEVLSAAFTKPFGIMPFYPGPGVGGHCIPLDPHYLEWKAKSLNFSTHFIALAGEINRRMPEFVRDKAWRCLNKVGIAASQSKILVLGVAYKKDLNDCRESASLEVIHLLKKDGAQVFYHDPWVPVFSTDTARMESRPLTAELVQSADLVIIATDHSNVDYDLVLKNAKHVLDTRNATKSVRKPDNNVTLL